MMATSITNKVQDQPKATFFERVAKKAQALCQEGKVRFGNAVQAYEAEVQWQTARRQPAPKAPVASSQILAGILVDTETGDWIALQEGLNAIEPDAIRVEKGVVEGTGALASRSYYSNDTLTLAGKTYLLKLFSSARFSHRVELSKECQ